MSSKANRATAGIISLEQLERRPVQATDKWCHRQELFNGHVEPIEKDPWGYVVTVPFIPSTNIHVEGDYIIVRSKKHCNKLLLQVIPQYDAPNYGVKSFARHQSKTKKSKKKKMKLFRILNVRNLNKTEGKW